MDRFHCGTVWTCRKRPLHTHTLTRHNNIYSSDRWVQCLVSSTQLKASWAGPGEKIHSIPLHRQWCSYVMWSVMCMLVSAVCRNRGKQQASWGLRATRLSLYISDITLNFTCIFKVSKRAIGAFKCRRRIRGIAESRSSVAVSFCCLPFLFWFIIQRCWKHTGSTRVTDSYSEGGLR